MELRENNPSPSWDGLGKRIFSAIILVAIGGICLGAGGILFDALILFVALIMMKEWDVLTTREMMALRLFGYMYVVLPCACLLWLRNLATPTENGLGFTLCLALAAIISTTDIGAYFIGKRFGHYKLAPSISPNKTWEGLGGGVCFAALTGCLFVPYLHIFHSFLTIVFLSAVIAVVAQIGDLFQSWVKRLAGVKDAGSILPGHGGLLDRFDGYMFAAPLLALIVYFAHR